MKNFGAVVDYDCERADDLQRAYNEYCASVRVITPQVMGHVVNMPSARFYVSEERAAIIVGRIIKGDNLLTMLPTKREMYQEIYRRFCVLQRQYPHETVLRLVRRVIRQPAPKFYLTPSYARVIMRKHKQRWKRETLRRLRLL